METSASKNTTFKRARAIQLAGGFIALSLAVVACTVVVDNKLENKQPVVAQCKSQTDCNDLDLCNGVEQCTPDSANADERGCVAGVAAANGQACDVDGDPNTRDLCSRGACGLSRCGDGFVDPNANPVELCDDGNERDDDGCKQDCTFTCTTAMQCDDTDPCNGRETCNTDKHLCRSGLQLADETPCSISGKGGVCQAGKCQVP